MLYLLMCQKKRNGRFFGITRTFQIVFLVITSCRIYFGIAGVFYSDFPGLMFQYTNYLPE
ncbi:MAG: hypothetical protein JWP37_1835 [Mucilaginibacter sp.]|nr:hypothetical protein [Mucilaginibacter sp.]